MQVAVFFEPDDFDGEVTPQAILEAAQTLKEAGPLRGLVKRLVEQINTYGEQLEYVLDELDNPERAVQLRKLQDLMKGFSLR